ncbi:MAG: hypothetical protein E7402_03940 [Ruminococcaceae bacterium]|nr:hypothetical protein [Oscillospiraceae bacterium]
MKTVFIVNPKAGRGKKFRKTMNEIHQFCKLDAFDAECYITKAPQDASRFVKDYCAMFGPARFIACGGDGTLNEVLNGAMGCEGAEVGVVPIGTGNDFRRNFKTGTDFYNLESQVLSSCVRCDAVRYRLMSGGKETIGYCANMFNIGFDCAVADFTGTVKEKTFFSGTAAYVVSIFVALLKKETYCMDVAIDGNEVYSGKLLLTSIANGKYCGGGLKTNPVATVDSGLLNINMVKNLSRRRLLSILPSYCNGSYINRTDLADIVSTKNGACVTVIPHTGRMRISVDGEIVSASRAEFTIVPRGFAFVVPMASAQKTHQEEISIDI